MLEKALQPLGVSTLGHEKENLTARQGLLVVTSGVQNADLEPAAQEAGRGGLSFPTPSPGSTRCLEALSTTSPRRHLQSKPACIF